MRRSTGGSRGAALALFASLFLAGGCTDKGAAKDIEPAADPGDLDAVEIESEAEAYERAQQEIDAENWEQEMQELEREIEEDPYANEGG